MGLHIRRHDGETIAIDMPDTTRYMLEYIDNSLICRRCSSVEEVIPVFEWSHPADVGTTIGLLHNIQIKVTDARDGSKNFIIDAPHNVIVSRGDDIRTADDRLREELSVQSLSECNHFLCDLCTGKDRCLNAAKQRKNDK